MGTGKPANYHKISFESVIMHIVHDQKSYYGGTENGTNKIRGFDFADCKWCFSGNEMKGARYSEKRRFSFR